MPANPYARDLRKVTSTLSDETKKIRKSLFVCCLASIAVTLGKLYPTEITALGMKITPNSHSMLLLLMALVVTYHLLTFFIYASSDMAHWYVNHFSSEWEDDVANYEKLQSEAIEKSKLSEEDRKFMEEIERRLGSIRRGEGLKTGFETSSPGCCRRPQSGAQSKKPREVRA